HFVLFLEPPEDQPLFVAAEPRGFGGIIGQEIQGDDAGEEGGNALDQEKPLPCGQVAGTVHGLQYPSRDRPRDHARQGNGAHESRHHAGAVAAGEPERQIEDYARKEARFHHAEQEAHRVETRRPPDQHGARGDDSPDDHDRADPITGAHPLHDHVAGHLEKEVADEEDSGANAVDGVAHAQVLLHLELGEPHVDAVHVSQDVAEEDEGHKPPRDLPVGGGFEIGAWRLQLNFTRSQGLRYGRNAWVLASLSAPKLNASPSHLILRPVQYATLPMQATAVARTPTPRLANGSFRERTESTKYL